MAFSHQRWDRDSFAEDTSLFDLDLELLPLTVAPIEDQLRVFVNGTEYTFDDGSDPNLLTNKWSHTPPVPTAGAASIQVRIGAYNQDDASSAKFTEVYFEDPDGQMILQLSSRWTGLNVPQFVNDLLGVSTNVTFSGPDPGTFNFYDFSTRAIIKKVAMSRPGVSAGTEVGTRLSVDLNIGTVANPIWFNIHTEDTNPIHTDFPIAAVDSIIPWLDGGRTVKEMEYVGPGTVIPAQIQITPPLSATSDYVVLLRETRQDQPWVDFVPGAPARAFTMDTYWRQLLFIAQELCEYKDVGPMLGLGPASDTDRNFFLGDQQQLHLNHATATVYDYSSIELLEGVPGAPSNPSSQLVVEIGDASDGTSTNWQIANEETTPADHFDYDIQAGDKTITLGSTTTKDVRIRRVTKIDDLWLTLSDPLAWATAQVTLNQKQIRFLFEEACIFPQLYSQSPLSASIYPRAWNWLTYAGDASIFYFSGPYWGGDGVVVVFVNDVLQTEGVDYTVNSLDFSIDFTSALTGSDSVDIGASGGGFSGGGAGIGGGDSGPSGGGSDSNNSTPTPKAPMTNIIWPGNDAIRNRGITISIGAVSNAALLVAGGLEGNNQVDSLSQGNATAAAFSGHAMRIQGTVTLPDFVGDGVGGFLPVGATAVAYVNRWCAGETIGLDQIYYLYHAEDLDGDGVFGSVAKAGAAFGCLIPGGTGGGALKDMWQRWKAAGSGQSVSSQDDVNLRLFNSLDNLHNQINSDPTEALFFNDWVDLNQRSQDADTAGVVTESGFTDAQWRDHLDPDTTFSDFDIP